MVYCWRRSLIMKQITITFLCFLPFLVHAQEERRDTAWKKNFRRTHSDSLHKHMVGDTLLKVGDEIEYRRMLGVPTIVEQGYKVLLHKMPKDTVIFLDHNSKPIVFLCPPFKPVWEKDTDWFQKAYRHHRSKIDSL